MEEAVVPRRTPKVSRDLESNDFKEKLPEGRNIYSGGQATPEFNKYLCGRGSSRLYTRAVVVEATEFKVILHYATSSRPARATGDRLKRIRTLFKEQVKVYR